MSLSTFVESIESRRLFATGGFDPTWHYSQAAVDAAAGTHLDVTDVVAGTSGRTFLLGHGDDLTRDDSATRSYVVALDAAGRPDAQFAVNGVLATSFDGAALTVDADGLLYVAGTIDRRVMRYRFYGYRDTRFGEKGVVRLPAGAGFSFVSDRPGRLLTTVADATDRTVGVLAVTADGVSTIHEESYAPADPDYGPTLQTMQVVPTDAGLALVYGEQFYDQTYHDQGVDPTAGYSGYDDLRGDVHVTLMDDAGNVRRTRAFDVGESVGNVRTIARGDGVRIVLGYNGEAHRRVVDVTATTSIRRSFIDLPINNSEDRSALILPNGRSVVVGSVLRADGRWVSYATLATADGTPNTGFGRRGVLSYQPYDGVNDVLNVAVADDGALLLGRSYSLNNEPQYDLQRVTPDAAPLADLIDVQKPKRGSQFGVATVRYFAQGGLVRRTLTSPDLTVADRLGPVGVRLLGTRQGDDGSVTARYRFNASNGGRFRFTFNAKQVASADGTVNAGRLLASITGINVVEPVLGYNSVRNGIDGARQYKIVTTFTSPQGVSIASARQSHLVLTGPDGNTFRADALRAFFPHRTAEGVLDRSTIEIDYRVTHDGDDWTPADAGSYTAVLPAGSLVNGQGTANLSDITVLTLEARPADDFA